MSDFYNHMIYIVTLGSLDAMRRETASVRRKGAMTSRMAILRRNNGAFLLSEAVNHLQHCRHNLTTVLDDNFHLFTFYRNTKTATILHKVSGEEVVLAINQDEHILLGNGGEIEGFTFGSSSHQQLCMLLEKIHNDSWIIRFLC